MKRRSDIRILVGCEFSGIVRDAFKQEGFNAWSCDLLPTEIKGQHIQADVLSILNDGWDMAIFHPPCTRLCNSGVRWLHERNLWKEMEKSAQFFLSLLTCDIPYIAVENPVPHKYAMNIIKQKYSQTIQPWQFGHSTSKRTCLWLKNLPLLKATTEKPNTLTYEIHTASPTKNRWKMRSKTFQGIALAFASQWGKFIDEKI